MPPPTAALDFSPSIRHREAMLERERGADVVVVGAGLIGLAIAYELARRGATARIYDEREPGTAASWAGAGMLAPYTERLEHAAYERFCVESLRRYPEFAAELQRRTGLDPQLRLDGTLEVAERPGDEAAFAERAAALAASGVSARVLTEREIRASEPALGSRALGGLLVEGEGQIDNRRLARALRAACASLGVRIETGAGKATLEADARRVRGVRTARGFAAADCVVNAAGAWASELDGVPEHARVAVAPVKGQMLALAVPPGFVRRVTWVGGAYLVPRGDGRLLVGASVEHCGFDTRVTAGPIRALLDAALAAMPALRDFALTETWAGLRPGTADGLPFIGATELAGYVVATGHYRNGILLTPQTAHVVADLVEGRAVDGLAAFSPLRLREVSPADARENALR